MVKLTLRHNPYTAQLDAVVAKDKHGALTQPAKWLRALEPGTIESDKFAGLCQPFPAEQMEAYPVSTIVNSPKNDLPECIVPAASINADVS